MRKSDLKRRLHQHLRDLGYKKNRKGNLVPPEPTKDSIRNVHSLHRSDVLKRNTDFANRYLPKLKRYFASGPEVEPSKIRPRLQLIGSNTWESALFRLATLSWSIPVSSGFGRRMRYLVWDQHNGKLIGLIALGDPVFNLKVRDNHIGWDSNARKHRLVNLLDAYVLGAIPPYNFLLGGKLVACLVRTDQIRRDFQSKYGKSIGIISQKNKNPKLVMVTTSSALGRSSVYNRLKINSDVYFRSIGFTGGWGHFHVPDDLFWDLREYLRNHNHAYVDGHRFGDGPNWRLRTIRAALDALAFPGDLLRHGIRREVFVSNIAVNAVELLRGECKRPNFSSLKSIDEVSELAKKRWVEPRSERQPSYCNWNVDDFEIQINTSAALHIGNKT